MHHSSPQRRQAPPPSRRWSYVPRLEPLEARAVPTTVTNLADAGPGSLRQAILDTPAGGRVDFQPGLSGTIVLFSRYGALDIRKDVTIAGPGPGLMSVSGNDLSRVFQVEAGVTATLTGLTLTHGRAPRDDRAGGGLWNAGTLTLLAHPYNDECFLFLPSPASDILGTFRGGIEGRRAAAMDLERFAAG